MFCEIDLEDFEQSFLEHLSKLKDSLVDDNYVNMGNIQRSNISLDRLWTYVKQVVDRLTNKIENYKLKIQQLKQIILKLNPNEINYAVLQSEQSSDEQFHLKSLQNLHSKFEQKKILKPTPPVNFNKALLKKGKVTAKDGPEFSNFPIRVPSSNQITKRKMYKDLLKSQTQTAAAFIRDHMQHVLQYDLQKRGEVPKNSLLNCYIRWNEKNGRKIADVSHSMIQMALTNEVKHLFPKVQMNHRNFKGLKYKKEYSEFQQLTDVFPVNKNDYENEESYDHIPLPQFDD